MKLKVKDIVRVRPIPPGQLWWETEQSCTFCWVERVSSSGHVALVRVARYDPDELDFVSSLKDLEGEA